MKTAKIRLNCKIGTTVKTLSDYLIFEGEMRTKTALAGFLAFVLLISHHQAWALINAPEDLHVQAVSRRVFPGTERGIHVFNDQLAPSMSDGQWQFAATHYAGTQKMLRKDADRLRSINPSFLILHYRLGLGLGYRAIQAGCQPTGDWITIIEGNEWVRECPERVQENWFYHYPEGSTTRVLNCDWSWYLMNLDDNDWREYWHGEVLRQMQANDNDGVFMDSLSVPNYMGYDCYVPQLPAIDERFENTWSDSIANWLSWLQSQPVGEYWIIPNVGSWINSRDRTDYSAVDGVMVEGFAIQGDRSPYEYGDWQLQMNRVLGLVQHRIIIGQTYVNGDRERMFAVGIYLLVKGDHTYLNIELGPEPEWYPEYDIPIGAPKQSPVSDIQNLYSATIGVYRRDFDNGFVLVNARESGTAVRVNLGETFYLVQTSGGGIVSDSGLPTGRITYQAVESVSLLPYSAAVLLNTIPSSMLTLTSKVTTGGATLTSQSLPATSTDQLATSTITEEERIPGFTSGAIILGVVAGLFALARASASQPTYVCVLYT